MLQPGHPVLSEACDKSLAACSSEQHDVSDRSLAVGESSTGAAVGAVQEQLPRRSPPLERSEQRLKPPASGADVDQPEPPATSSDFEQCPYAYAAKASELDVQTSPAAQQEECMEKQPQSVPPADADRCSDGRTTDSDEPARAVAAAESAAQAAPRKKAGKKRMRADRGQVVRPSRKKGRKRSRSIAPERHGAAAEKPSSAAASEVQHAVTHSEQRDTEADSGRPLSELAGKLVVQHSTAGEGAELDAATADELDGETPAQAMQQEEQPAAQDGMAVDDTPAAAALRSRWKRPCKRLVRFRVVAGEEEQRQIEALQEEYLRQVGHTPSTSSEQPATEQLLLSSTAADSLPVQHPIQPMDIHPATEHLIVTQPPPQPDAQAEQLVQQPVEVADQALHVSPDVPSCLSLTHSPALPCVIEQVHPQLPPVGSSPNATQEHGSDSALACDRQSSVWERC